MNSSLPNFLPNPATMPAASSAGARPHAASIADARCVPADQPDFEALMSSATATEGPPTPVLALIEVGAPSVADQAAPSGDASAVLLAAGDTAQAATGGQTIPREVLEQAVAMAVSSLQTLPPELQAPLQTFAAGGQGSSVASLQEKFTLAADGAWEMTLATPTLPATTAGEAAPAGSMAEATLEFELAGGSAVRLTLIGQPVADTTAATQATLEKFAGAAKDHRIQPDSNADGLERNFVLTEQKAVTPQTAGAGIAVAQSDEHMSAAPTEEFRVSHKPQDASALPARPDFQVAQPPMERISMPATEPAGQSFALRAVETVTGLAEAQFAASMQRAGAVHLRLKFGGEDLSVHVALRDGVVHTSFRTDSVQLRDAIAREWQAVVAQSPAQMMRYVEPVFAPASSGVGSGGGDTAQQQSPRQQQSHSDAGQQRPHSPPSTEASPFARRSAVPANFIPEPPAPRVPALSPHSLRLSALA